MRPGFNEATWPALREYIDACIALAIARHERKATAKLEEQVTRMETAIRGYMPEDPAAARARYLDKHMPSEAEIGTILKKVKKRRAGNGKDLSNG